MKLLVVILNYRVTELTIDCLRSLAGRIGRVPGARVAVCENGSGGDAAERLQAEIDRNGWGEWCSLTSVYPNLGFTGGNNVVIRAALASPDPPEYVLLLNSDTLAHDGALEALVDFMDAHPRVGIAGSQLVNPDGSIQASPFRFHGIASQFDAAIRFRLVHRLLARWWVVAETPTQASACDWVSGASMILRRAMLDEIGLLDEGLYTYYDDVDLCWRALRAGWETWYVPQSRITHLEGAATGIVQRVTKRRPPYWFQARRRFFLRNHGRFYTALVDLVTLLGLAMYRLRCLFLRRTDTDPPHFMADAFRHSVFVTGFRVTEVENPALKEAGAPPAQAAAPQKKVG